MSSLPDRILHANALLAPYAVRHDGLWGRERPEDPDQSRTPFQRDRDRIIHTQAFRRLQGKTQVFVAGEGDHYRTRLTHTVEMSLVSRDLARVLGLNEDLAECVALAHDLGHPPFGHAGEEAIHLWMKTQGERFDHNDQSLRLVTVLEQHTRFAPGLNLQREVIEGLRKHSLAGKQHTLEAQAVDIADEIAYTAHDCDDGLTAGLFSIADIADIPFIAQANTARRERGTALRGAIIRLLVADVIAESEKRIGASGVRTLEDAQALPRPLVAFSEDMRSALNEWRDFLWKHMYLHPLVVSPMQDGQQLLLGLCQYFLKTPSDKILSLQKRTQSTLPAAIKDYVAGMTDAFARDMGEELGVEN
jgi:dGTPase